MDIPLAVQQPERPRLAAEYLRKRCVERADSHPCLSRIFLQERLQHRAECGLRRQPPPPLEHCRCQMPRAPERCLLDCVAERGASDSDLGRRLQRLIMMKGG